MKRPAKKPAGSRSYTSKDYHVLKKSNQALMETAIETLKEHARILDEQNSKLKDENSKLKDETLKLKDEKLKLIIENNSLALENTQLQEEIHDLL